MAKLTKNAKKLIEELLEVTELYGPKGPRWGDIATELDSTLGERYSVEAIRSHARRQGYQANYNEAQKLIKLLDEVDMTSAETILLSYGITDPENWKIIEISIKPTKHIPDFDQDMTWNPPGYMNGKKSRGPEVFKQAVHIKIAPISPTPVGIEPFLSSIEVTGKIKRPKTKPKNTSVRTVLIGGDEQIGFERDAHGNLISYHDDHALDLFIQVAEETQPEEIHLVGDLLDLAALSRYSNKPGMVGTTQLGLFRAHWHLLLLRIACPNTHISLHIGNHEQRIDKAILAYVNEFFGLRRAEAGAMNLSPLLALENLLHLEALHVEVTDTYPNGEAWLNDAARTEHGTATGAGRSGKTSIAVAKASDFTTFQGHNHRMEFAIHTKWARDGYHYVGAGSFGCLAKVDGPPSFKDRMNHQQGFGIWQGHAASQVGTVSMIPIEFGTCIFNGKEYVGQGIDEIEFKKYFGLNN